MVPFWRAIRLSFRYRWSICASVACALLIGLLWGVSITTVYPFVEVVLQGRTIDTWLNEQIASADKGAAEAAREAARLRQEAARADGVKAESLRAEAGLHAMRLVAERKAAARYRRLQPLLAGRVPATPFATLLFVLTLLVIATVVKGICLVLNSVLVARIADRTVLDMRRMFYRATLEMDQKVLDYFTTPSLTSMIAHNTNFISAGLRSLYGTSVREPLKMAACLIGAGLISWRLLVLSLVVAPVGGVLVQYLSRRMKRAAGQECGGAAVMLQALLETLNGIKVVRIFNRERRERQRFKESAALLYRMGMRMSFYDALLKPVTELTGILTIVLAILAGAYLVLQQQTHLLGIRISDRPLSPSSLFMFYAMLAGAADPARKMGDIYNVLVRAAAATKGLFEVFEVQSEVRRPTQPRAVARHSRSLRFEDVWFGYGPYAWNLMDATFEIPFGQTVAIVGENGAGKSTILNLIARFYDPQKGGIYLDDVDLRRMSPKNVRRHLALVPQDPLLFRGTIWENLVYGRPHATRDEVHAAAELARVADFVADLPQGYDTPVGDGGTGLSGGQRQRVALARAILADRPILVLDEATSQIDQRCEELVQDSMRAFLRGRTTVLVTHRPSTIRLAQRVLVVHKGRIVEDLPAAVYLRRLEEAAPALAWAG